MSITFDGVFSGFNTTAMIEAILTGSYQRNILRESQISQNQLKLDRFSQLSGHLSDLSSTIDSITDSRNGIESQSYTATYSEGFGYTATAGAGAVAGTYDVEITSLAKSQIDSSNQTFADYATSGVIAQGTLSVDVGGTVTSITIDGTNDSVSGLADELNNVAGISAYVLDTGDVTDPYQLVVQSETGAANNFTIDTTGLTGPGTAPTFSNVQAGSDATATINGIAVSSSSNSINAVPGLTIEATESGLGQSTIVVGLDKAAFQEQVQTFLDDFNEIVNFYERNTVYDSDSNIAGPLTGESVARGVVDRLQTLATSDYSGVSGSLTLLAQIGIETNQDGTLSLDTVQFEEALEDNFEDVVELLTSDSGPLAAVQAQIDDVYVNTNGLLDSRRDTLQDEIGRLQEDVDRETERIESRTETLRAQFTKMEEAFAELQNAGSFLSSLFAAPPSNNNSNS